jgi:hypothetical protein
MSRAIGWLGRWGIAVLVIVIAGCGGDGAPVAPGTTGSPTSEPTSEEPSPEVDLEAGWTVIADYGWPVQPGCCGMADVGPTSPVESLDWDEWEHDPAEWPPDGFYAAEVLRTADAPGQLQLTVHRWVTCSDLPDDPCAPDPEPDPVSGADLRIGAEPGTWLQRTVPIQDLGVVLVPIHQFGAAETIALDGEPGACATLLAHGIDPAYAQWVTTPSLEGTTIETIRDVLLERSSDPTFPFGVDYCEGDLCGPVAYRGPFDTSLLADPSWGGPSNGVYNWRPVTLEVRDGKPILHLWAGQIGG